MTHIITRTLIQRKQHRAGAGSGSAVPKPKAEAPKVSAPKPKSEVSVLFACVETVTDLPSSNLVECLFLHENWFKIRRKLLTKTSRVASVQESLLASMYKIMTTSTWTLMPVIVLVGFVGFLCDSWTTDDTHRISSIASIACIECTASAQIELAADARCNTHYRFYRSLSLSLSHSLSLSVCLSLSITHTHIHTHSHAQIQNTSPSLIRRHLCSKFGMVLCLKWLQ
jgi:hypothetical protein